MSRRSSAAPARRDRGWVSAWDLTTRDKLEALDALLPRAQREGRILDLGSGTGYTAYAMFSHCPTVCLDLHEPNLRYHRDKIQATAAGGRHVGVVARATALPFKDGVFQSALCSEVLEHLEDDAGAVRELARVLQAGGRALITVPYTGLGVTSFLELAGLKTMHDVPGLEFHVRPGYDERSLEQLLAPHHLEMERHTYYLRFFTRLTTDVVSLLHRLYQRLVHHRRTWNWSEVGRLETSLAFRLYASALFPALWTLSRLDRCLRRYRGFGLVALARKRTA